MTDDRVQIKRTMRLGAVQENRYGSYRDMRHQQRCQHQFPEREIQKTMNDEIQLNTFRKRG